jgi:hypothetical protein
LRAGVFSRRSKKEIVRFFGVGKKMRVMCVREKKRGILGPPKKKVYL